MMRRKKVELRHIGRSVLEDLGFATEVQTGQGLLPGARLLAKKDGQAFDVAVRTSHQRALSFTLQSNGRFRGLSVDFVVVVVPAQKNSDILEVLVFKSSVLKRRFSEALKGMEEADRSSRFQMPIFVPLDKESRKNVGHGVSNLKQLALWTVRVGADELKLKTSSAAAETFIDRVKREFAEKNEVDVSKVLVEFRILT
jgi:hypothetical protein